MTPTHEPLTAEDTMIPAADIEKMQRLFSQPAYAQTRSHLERRLVATISALQAHIAELEREREWRPISEAPREEGTEILVSDGETVWATEWMYGYGFVQAGTDAPGLSVQQLDDCTHWMPLPSPPQEQQHE